MPEAVSFVSEGNKLKNLRVSNHHFIWDTIVKTVSLITFVGKYMFFLKISETLFVWRHQVWLSLTTQYQNLTYHNLILTNEELRTENMETVITVWVSYNWLRIRYNFFLTSNYFVKLYQLKQNYKQSFNYLLHNSLFINYQLNISSWEKVIFN